jgi:hypothetical protein
MKKFNLYFITALAFAFVIMSGCKKDETVDLALVSLTAGDADLNGATAAMAVPANADIVATFNKDIDVAGVTASMVQDYDQANITVTVAVSGKQVTITPAGQATGAKYILSLDMVKATDGTMLATALTRSYTTDGGFVPSGLFAYWPFDGAATDALGSYNPSTNGVVDITYGADRIGAENGAAIFNGTTSIIEVPNGDALMNSQNFTISFWMKTNSTNKTSGHWVIGLGAFYGIQFEVFGAYDGAKFAVSYTEGDTAGTSEDMWFPSLATDNTNGGWQGWDYAKSLTADEMVLLLKDHWLQVVYTFDGVAKRGTLYYNGEKMKSFDFNLWPDGDAKRVVTAMKYRGQMPDVNNDLAFGFIQSRAGSMWASESWGGYIFPESNHFKGSLDEVRIFHKALSTQEVELMYNSEKQ